MPARGARFRPTFEPSVSVRSENRAGKPYLATTARRTEAMAAASRWTVAVPWNVGAPGATRPRMSQACSSTRSVWASRLVLPVSSTVITANSPGSSSDGANQTGVVTGGTGAAERRQRDVLRRGQRVVGGAHGCGTGIRLVHDDSVGGARERLLTGFAERVPSAGR